MERQNNILKYASKRAGLTSPSERFVEAKIITLLTTIAGLRATLAYEREMEFQDVIHVKIVMATALMAIARKVIILDYEKISPDLCLGDRGRGVGVEHRLLVGRWF